MSIFLQQLVFCAVCHPHSLILSGPCWRETELLEPPRALVHSLIWLQICTHSYTDKWVHTQMLMERKIWLIFHCSKLGIELTGSHVTGRNHRLTLTFCERIYDTTGSQWKQTQLTLIFKALIKLFLSSSGQANSPPFTSFMFRRI